MRNRVWNALPWFAALAALAAGTHALADDWPSYGREPGGTRYSPLAQITPENVSRLRVAWTFHTGDLSDGLHGQRKSGFESTPLVIDGRLFLTTPFNRVIALDPATGRKLWVYDPRIDRTLEYGDGFVNRGLASWRDPDARPNARAAIHACALRLFEATLDARLIALDAATGAPCPHFGNGGQVDLRNVAHFHAGWYHMTSPPVVLDGVVVVGSSINDNARVDMPDGVVRGYDARSGRLLWSWEPLERPPGVSPGAWKSGAANAWTIAIADPERHLVYIPTGSASPDYYGGLRPGDDRWADSVVALNPRSGKLVWGFQLVHHDLWDYDTAAPPLLTSITLNGQEHPVLIAGNKTGMLYVLDPSTGKPVLPIQERPVPQSTVSGEVTAPTQPFPTTLPRLGVQSLTPQSGWGLNEADRNACQAILQGLSGLTLFSPPSLEGAAAVPGTLGGMNWSGYAWDARHEHLIVAVSNMPYEVQLIRRWQFMLGKRASFRASYDPQTGSPYFMGRNPLRLPSGMLCTAPPWGEVVAVDLAAGRIVWHVPLGRMDEPFPNLPKRLETGSVILGGPIVTGGGLIFIGGSMDRRFHALDAATGHELWTAALPASAHAQPITYETDGRQFVVIAAGGAAHIDEERAGDALVAFALP